MARQAALLTMVLAIAATADPAAQRKVGAADPLPKQPDACAAAFTNAGISSGRVIIGPLVPTPQSNQKPYLCEVHGPIWDGTSGGFWVVLQDQFSAQTHSLTAVLVDPASGQEKRRLQIPEGELVGHDGASLWIEVTHRDTSVRPVRTEQELQRISTVPDGPTKAELHRQPPEDLPAPIPMATFRFATGAPTISLYSPVRLTLPFSTSETADSPSSYILRQYVDARQEAIYARAEGGMVSEGAGYIWFYTAGELMRIPSDKLKPHTRFASWGPAGTRNIKDIARTMGTRQKIAAPHVEPLNEKLAWDGQRLWMLGTDTSNPARPQVRLICLDVGLGRHPDTSEGYQRALEFEKRNGTQKAIPLFEALLAKDPCAAEIRIHLARALTARPREPYYDIKRAGQLAGEALQWQAWNPDAWDTLAEIEWRMDQGELAARLESHAININPKNDFYWHQLDRFRGGPTYP